jgi:uncharacterized protein (TIGR03118 family)
LLGGGFTNAMYRIRFIFIGLILLQFATFQATLAQTNSYKQTNLVSDTAGSAPNVDTKLVNPWGIAYFPGQTFWIADNNSGYSTVYNQVGVNAGSFLVPPPAGSSNPSTPTGIVANVAANGFNVNGKPGLFIMDTEDGTISAWNGSDPVTLVVDNSKLGAVYKGLALISAGNTGNFLLATNFNSGAVEVFDSKFMPAQLTGNFTDPNLPAGFAPFGIHLVNQQIIITYAMQDQAKHDPVHLAGAGYVDVFNLNGGFVQRLVSQGQLNAPWGAVIPPTSFGVFGGKLLIGNFGDGVINAYDFGSGSFIDQMKGANGAAITNASLWDMVFGGGGASGDPNTLYITAGLANEQHGLFATISSQAAGTPGADFNISVTPATATLAAGQSASFVVTVGGLNGFNSEVTFSCSGQPANSTCSFSPANLTPTSGGNATTKLTVSTTGANSPGPYGMAATLPKYPMGLSGLLFAALILVVLFRSELAVGLLLGRLRLTVSSLVLAAMCLLALSGCGGGGSSTKVAGTPTGAATMMVVATSGSISHSINVNLTVQ